MRDLIAIALLRFVWQAGLVWLFAAVGLRALQQSSAQARYLFAIICLAVMCVLPIATVARGVMEPPEFSVGKVALSAVPDNRPAAMSQVPGTAPSSEQPLATNLVDNFRARVQPMLPAVFATWLFGVLVFFVRLCGGWWRVRRIVSRAEAVLDHEWRSRLHRLADRLGVSTSVRLLRSASVSVPVVIGWLRPAVVVPVSAFAGLAPADLEAILAHELAHIRRADYLVNLLQNLAETLFFYHPAVWWVSRQIRIEREHCCDDIAAAACGDRITYAEALASLETLRPRTPVLAVGAADGDLLARIRRLVEPEVKSSPVGSGGLMVSAVVVSVSLFVNVTAQSPAPLPAVAPLNLQAPAPAPLPMASPIARVAVAEPTPLILPRPTTEPVAPAIATGSIKGEVRDEDGGTIPGAEVSARTASGVVAGSAVTNSQGRFAFSDLPVDAYQITVSLPGFRTWSARVSVVEGETTPAGVKLILGALTEVVNIKAPASMVAAPPTPPVTNFSTSPNRTRTPSDEVLPVRPEQTGPVRVGGDIRQPKNLTRVTPEYSSDAIAAGVTGTVIIEAVVNTSGAVTDVKVLSGQPLLNEVVLAAVAQWRYTPTMLNGVARPISLTAAFNFTK